MVEQLEINVFQLILFSSSCSSVWTDCATVSNFKPNGNQWAEEAPNWPAPVSLVLNRCWEELLDMPVINAEQLLKTFF